MAGATVVTEAAAAVAAAVVSGDDLGSPSPPFPSFTLFSINDLCGFNLRSKELFRSGPESRGRREGKPRGGGGVRGWGGGQRNRL